MLMRQLAPVGLALALGGCGSIGAIGLPPFQKSSSKPIETTELPPLVGTMPDQAIREGDTSTAAVSGVGATDPTTAQQNAALGTGAVPPSGGAGGPVGRTDLLGGWTIVVQGESCRLFMTLTSWTGGYRASTRDCTSQTLQGISAWNLNGNEVTLSGTGGAPVARLFASGQNRFDGQTQQSQPITFYR